MIRQIPPINFLSISFAFGILLGAWVEFDLLSFLLICFALVGFLFLWPRSRESELVVLCLLFGLLGIFRFVLSIPTIDDRHIAHYAGSEVQLEAAIIQEPDHRENYTNYTLSQIKIYLDGKSAELSGRILLKAERYPEYKYGDVVFVSGQLEEPENFDTFDYRGYLSHQHIYVLMKYADIESTEIGQSIKPMGAILAVKGRVEDMINQLFHEPESSLLAGLLLGVRRGFSENFTEAMKRTGTTHIIAISGYNITIIIVMLQRLLSRLLPRKKQLPVFTIGIALFTLLVGASASVVRAALMGWLVLLAGHVGRRSQVTTSLLVASFIMLLLDPHTIWDVGFQLSFLATGGLIWVSPRVEEWGWIIKLKAHFDPKSDKQASWLYSFGRGVWLYGWESLLLTLSAQVLVVPLLLYTFGQLSIISPLVNVLVLFPIPWAMLTGAITVFLGLLWQIPAISLVLLAWLPLRYIVEVINWFAQIPFAKFEISSFPLWGVAGWYGVVGYWLVRKREVKPACEV